jgi:hypothetical protein
MYNRRVPHTLTSASTVVVVCAAPATFNGRVRSGSFPRPKHLAPSLVFASRGGQALREQSALLDEPTLQLEARGSLELLARGPEQDLVHVHLLRLADGEGDCLGERLGRNGNLIAFPDVLGDIRLGHAVRQFRGDRPR